MQYRWAGARRQNGNYCTSRCVVHMHALHVCTFQIKIACYQYNMSHRLCLHSISIHEAHEQRTGTEGMVWVAAAGFMQHIANQHTTESGRKRAHETQYGFIQIEYEDIARTICRLVPSWSC